MNRHSEPSALSGGQSQLSHRQIQIVFIGLMAGMLLGALDQTVVSTALPTIVGELGGLEHLSWVITAYLLTATTSMPLYGKLSDIYGRKVLYQFGIVIFLIGSLLSGLSQNMLELILFRGMQGLGAGGIMTMAQAIIGDLVSPRERGRYQGYLGTVFAVSAVAGPLLGGFFTDQVTWRWVFYINIPIGIAAFAMIRRFVTDPPYIRRGSAGIDYWGLSLLVVGIGALQIALDRGQEQDWFASHWITGLFVVAAAALVVLVRHQFAVRHPIVDLRVFRERTYATGVFLMMLMGFVLYGSLVIFPILLQTLMGYSPLESGIAMAPRGLGMLAATPIVGFLIARIDARKLLATGFGIGVVTLFWFSRLAMTAGYWDYFWPQFIQGVGFSLLFVPLTTVTMDRIPNAGMGNATSIFNLMRNIGGSMGIALTQTLLARHRQVHINNLGTHVSLYSAQTQQALQQLHGAFMAQGADSVTATRRAYAALWGTVQRHAAMLAFNDAFLVLAAVFLVLMPLTLAMRRPQSGPASGGAAPE